MSDREATLPPIGMISEADHGHCTTYLSNLVKEAVAGAAEWITRAERNLEIYSFGASPEPASSDVNSNAIQDSVNAAVDFQTKEASIWGLNPVERGEPSKVFYYESSDALANVIGPMKEDEAAAMMAQAVPVTNAMGQPQLDPQTLGPAMQPVYKPENFVAINDKSVAEFFEKPMDVYRKRGRLDGASRMCIHYANVFGFLFPLYDWDADYRRPRLWFDVPLRDTYIDPTRTTIDDFAYAGVDWWIDENLAKSMFPHLADIITERASTSPERPDSSAGVGSNATGQYQRNTVILRVFWIRNQPCPYETEEALQEGLLERRPMPMIDPDISIENPEQEFPRGVKDDESQGVLPGGEVSDDAAAVQPAAVLSPEPNVQADDEGADVLAQGSGNDNAAGSNQSVQPAPTRTALFAGDTEVTPPIKGDPTSLHPQWPMYRCTRQITAVLGLIVDDRECEYFDIPMLQMISTPIPYQPFGQGLPERLESMQSARTQVLTAIADHAEFNAHPVAFIPTSSWDKLPEEYKLKGAKRAGMTIPIDDQVLIASGGKPTLFLSPPPMSEALPKAEEIFRAEMSDRGGNPEVMDGKVPAGVESGYAIQLLTQNASNRFGFMQQWTRDMLTRLAKFLFHDMTNPRKVTPKDLRAIDSRYPLALISAFQTHGAAMEMNIDVDLQTPGSARSKKQALAVEANKLLSPITGLPQLSDEDLAGELGLDYQEQQRKNAKVQQQAMQMQLAQQMVNPQPEPGGKSGGSNGSTSKRPANGQQNGQHAANGNGRM
jgi:hypothetical protein